MLMEKLKKDIDCARKNKETEKLVFLSTLYSEASLVGKNNGNRLTTDEEVIKTMKKLVKSTKEVISILSSRGKSFDKLQTELDILNSYLPKQLSDTELTQAVDEIISSLGEKSPKLMGQVMATLKEKYNGLYDGKKASLLVKEKLS